jgi:hypothetical protein
LALRLAYRLALVGLRQEQRKHVVYSPEHSEYLASLVATTIIEHIGDTRVASLTRVALITLFPLMFDFTLATCAG